MIKSISILGCGWLGLPLAIKFGELSYHVKGSTTSVEKISLLKSSGIIPYLLSCESALIQGDNAADFFYSEKLFVNIPFRRDLIDPYDYVRQMRLILSHATRAGVKKIVMASSTSVYPLNNQVVKEDDKFELDNERSKALLEAENVFLGQDDICVNVVRFAGLYGPGRQIGNFLNYNRILELDGNVPVNLVHLEDCVRIVVAIFEGNFCSEIFNACGDAHPLRKDLYVHLAAAMNVKQPEFKENENPRYKIVSNDKVKGILGYRFVYSSPWGWIDKCETQRKK